MPYEALNAEKIIATVVVLRQRISERFPGSGLAALSGELEALARKAQGAADELVRPRLLLRLAIGALLLLILTGLGVTLYGLGAPSEPLTFVDFVQLLESGINDFILVGLGVFFLVSLERRSKRRRVLNAIHELRSIAHIVDMHQLTKDPEHVLRPVIDTPSSPRRTLDRFSLTRYLDYCSELLSLTGKIAALYVQRFDDDVVLAAVNEVETLTTGLSGKIWQKVMIIETLGASGSPLAP